MSETAAFLDLVRAGDGAPAAALLAADPSLSGSKDDNGISAVMLAMYYGHPQLVPVLVEHGAVLNLPEACAAGQLQAVERRLTEAPEELREYTSDGWTPLHLAVFFGHPEVAGLLLDRGADLTGVSRNPLGVTPLQSALARGHEACAALLIARGADVRSEASKGWPPITYTGANGLVKSAQLLLEHGADVNARTPDGKTALALAVEKGHSEVAALLRAHGGE